MKEFESRMTQKGQVTIPAEIRHLLGLKPKDKVRFVTDADGVRVRPAESKMAKHFGSVKPINRPEDWTAVRREFEELAAEDAMTRGQR
ncbi:MAG: AbrB/MazE/SpoVT family DNA-binding domain-containing protein [Thermomicrobiales bacterium]